MEIYGEETVQKAEIKVKWNRKTGYVTNVTYKGTPAKIATFGESLVGKEYVTDIDFTYQGSGTLQVTYQGNDDDGSGADVEADTTTAWSCQGVDLLLPICARSWWDDDLSTVDDATMRDVIQKWYTRTPDGRVGDPAKVKKLLDKGTTEYYVSQLMITKTEVTMPNILTVDFANVNRAVNLSDIAGLPLEISSEISNLPKWNAGQKQFLKRQPTIETLENDKYRVSHSWLWNPEWSKVIYGGDGNP